MIRSMTGYGGAKGVVEGLNVTVELKSVNNRYLDIAVRMPRNFLFAEDAVKSTIQQHVSRGKLDVFVTIDSSQAADTVLRVNEPLLRAYIDTLNTLAVRYDLKNDMSLMSLMRFPDILSVEKAEADQDKIRAGLVALTQQALADYDQMREREGAKLRADVEEKLARIESLVTNVEAAAPETAAAYEARLRQKLEAALAVKNDILSSIYDMPTYTVDQIATEYLEYAEKIRAHVVDCTRLLNDALRSGKKILFEGAQATQLDIDHGTYPFVTSSNCTAGGAMTGTGVGPTNVQKVLGIAKAYLTRVGSGPFPTELFDDYGATLGEAGHEYGVTTGRKRRCGWFDAVVARYAVDVNGLTDIALTKLDVLGAVDRIKICTAYEADGQTYDYVPSQQTAFHHAKPIYEEMPSWKCDISGCRTYDELPQEAKDYVERLEELVGCRISIVTVGPDRDQTIMRGWE